MAKPSQVGDSFTQRISGLLKDYDDLVLAVRNKRRQASLETMLAEQTVMSLGVLWESFLHDLLIAYVERHPLNCRNDFAKKVNKLVIDKLPGTTQWIRFNFPSSPTPNQLEHLIDPKGWNIAAKSAAELGKQANNWLGATDARKFALNADDATFFDYLVALRNYLAHRSEGSRGILSQKVKDLSQNPVNSDLRAQLRQVGTYLKQQTAIGTRVNSIGQRLIDISNILSR